MLPTEKENPIPPSPLQKPITNQPSLLFWSAAYCAGVMGELTFVGAGVHGFDVDLVRAQADGRAFTEAKTYQVDAYAAVLVVVQVGLPYRLRGLHGVFKAVTFFFDAGADVGAQVADLAPLLLQHVAQDFAGEAHGHAAPADVREGHHVLSRIIDHKRHTIRKGQKHAAIGQAGDDGIGHGEALALQGIQMRRKCRHQGDVVAVFGEEGDHAVAGNALPRKKVAATCIDLLGDTERIGHVAV